MLLLQALTVEWSFPLDTQYISRAMLAPVPSQMALPSGYPAAVGLY